MAAVITLAVIISRRSGMMQVDGLRAATPTPVTAAFDRTVVTREVCLPEEVWYTIQTGVFSQQEAAAEKAAAYADRGAPGTVVEDGGKWRVFIASYGREEDAATVRQRLGEMQRVETYQYAWTCPELRLRLTGMAGQLDVAEAGLTLFAGAGALLRDASALLDAGQITVDEALKTVSDLSAQISLWAETAQDRFGRQTPEMVQQLLQRAEGWTARAKALQEAAASVHALSASLKGHGMQMYDEEIRARRQLSGE
ncbi:MAG: SPOR domain-containing protein [Clostridia bacterium]|nr:SPOR domain-containing protein [Clostridia bacterium]